MSKLKRLIALQTSNLGVRALARALGLSVGAVSKYLRAVRASKNEVAEGSGKRMADYPDGEKQGGPRHYIELFQN